MFGCMLQFRGLWDLEMVNAYGLMSSLIEVVKSRNNWGETASVSVEIQGSMELENTGSVFVQFYDEDMKYIETKEIEFDA